jgi:predicted N-formylglutamate amidohydrolase
VRERPIALVISCEHGGHRVPARWREAMRGATALLPTHRGFDAGALELARRLARSFAAPLFGATVSRLVVDLNRGEGHPRVFSEFTAGLAAHEREELLATMHRPHRMTVHAGVAAGVVRAGAVLHLAVHSFTPVLHGVRRNADVGLLYDPTRTRERSFAARWRTALHACAPALRVRSNYPYRGVSDGVTRWLRCSFADRRYAGLELEMNQALLDDRTRWHDAMRAIERSLHACLPSHAGAALGVDAGP